jgi:hypothetical protein
MRAGYKCGTILSDNFGFTRTTYLSDGSQLNAEVKWAEVERVLVYKRDLFAYDVVCLTFGTAEGAIETDEEMEGWKVMIAALQKYLPGIRSEEEWWEKVAQPAFATNMTQIFPPR